MKVTREAAIWADDHALAKRGRQIKRDSYSLHPRVGYADVELDARGTGITGRTSPMGGGVMKAQGAGEKPTPRVLPLKCYFCGGARHIKTLCTQLKASRKPKPVSLAMGGERKVRAARCVT